MQLREMNEERASMQLLEIDEEKAQDSIPRYNYRERTRGRVTYTD